MRNTIRNVTMVVAVLMTSCHALGDPSGEGAEPIVDDGVPARRPWHAINVSTVPTIAHGFLVPGSARRAVRSLCYLLPRCQSCWWSMTSRTC
jgi:hypothetical protein